MHISLDWISDYLDLPKGLDPHDLAERFTRTSAEVEEVSCVDVGAKGLIAARVLSYEPIAERANLRKATLDVGGNQTVETVSAAPILYEGVSVVYAPPGASTAKTGQISATKVAGVDSVGMILPGEAVGIRMAVLEAVFLNDSVEPGTELDPELFNDWLIEVDNKSLTHRPDMWGHYGVAREMAAILGVPLKPYPIAPLEEIQAGGQPKIAIDIEDALACRRYSGIRLEGVPTKPAPLWMQLRLGRAGMRPISALVDLTNYIMADLGQPMHAFDADKVTRIEVGWARDGERFTTLDGVERTLTDNTLMIKCADKPIALAGVMGGLETEVIDSTTTLLLESANFDAATVRRTAGRLGLRTDASARFEKSLDPVHTALSIQRFVHLARPIFPNLKIASPLSDNFPGSYDPVQVTIKPNHVARTVGKEMSTEEITRILKPLGFAVKKTDELLRVDVPSFRATGDVSIEEDVIEEIARYVGYGAIPPAMPQVTVRDFEPNKLHDLEKDALNYFVNAERFVEIYGYLWYDTPWIAQIGLEPGDCVELRNPAAEGLQRLRKTLVPGLLDAVGKNRFHFPAFALIEQGSVFDKNEAGDEETRRLSLVKARRGKVEGELFAELKGAVERFAWHEFAQPTEFVAATPNPDHPWERDPRTTEVRVGGSVIGRLGVIDLDLRRAMDEHLIAWGAVWAELNMQKLLAVEHLTEPMGKIPPHPLVEMDFSFVVDTSTHYRDVASQLASFEHHLLRRISYVGAYEGKSVEKGKRSLTFRTVLGETSRTLVDEETNAFRAEFDKYIRSCGYGTR